MPKVTDQCRETQCHTGNMTVNKLFSTQLFVEGNSTHVYIKFSMLTMNSITLASYFVYMKILIGYHYARNYPKTR